MKYKKIILIPNELSFERIEDIWYAKNDKRKIRLEMTNKDIIETLNSLESLDLNKTESISIMYLLLVAALTVIEGK